MGRFVITAIRDLTGAGLDTEKADLKPVFPTSSSSQMITYKFSNGWVSVLAITLLLCLAAVVPRRSI
jgi:hypothetical protein